MGGGGGGGSALRSISSPWEDTGLEIDDLIPELGPSLRETPLNDGTFEIGALTCGTGPVEEGAPESEPLFARGEGEVSD